MPWNPHHIPRCRRHRAPGQAIVTINAHDIYLGPYDSKASHELYEQLIREWLANNRVLPELSDGFTMEELLAEFNEFAVKEYPPNTEDKQSEYENYRTVMKWLRKLFPDTLVTDFGPNKLRTMREEVIARGWTRVSINRQISRVRRSFRWAVSRELIPVAVHQALQTVEGLRSS